eukprot:3062336-Rhodomonas_salina.2
MEAVRDLLAPDPTDLAAVLNAAERPLHAVGRPSSGSAPDRVLRTSPLHRSQLDPFALQPSRRVMHATTRRHRRSFARGYQAARDVVRFLRVLVDRRWVRRRKSCETGPDCERDRARASGWAEVDA